jgi:hypothetical protein
VRLLCDEIEVIGFKFKYQKGKGQTKKNQPYLLYFLPSPSSASAATPSPESAVPPSPPGLVSPSLEHATSLPLQSQCCLFLAGAARARLRRPLDDSQPVPAAMGCGSRHPWDEFPAGGHGCGNARAAPQDKAPVRKQWRCGSPEHGWMPLWLFATHNPSQDDNFPDGDESPRGPARSKRGRGQNAPAGRPGRGPETSRGGGGDEFPPRGATEARKCSWPIQPHGPIV